MKIRTDFVTNSSSSSFIIAVKDGVTEKEAEAFVDTYFTSTIDKTLTDLGSDAEEDSRDQIVADLVSNIMNVTWDENAMKLNGWTITAGEASSDDPGALYVLHNSGEYNSPKIKFKNVGC